jgi:hypothetical protein
VGNWIVAQVVGWWLTRVGAVCPIWILYNYKFHSDWFNLGETMYEHERRCWALNFLDECPKLKKGDCKYCSYRVLSGNLDYDHFDNFDSTFKPFRAKEMAAAPLNICGQQEL